MLSQPPGADDVYYAPAQSAGPVPMLQWGSQGCSSYTSSGSGPTEVTGQPSPPCIALVMSSNLFPASSVSRLEWHSFLALPLLGIVGSGGGVSSAWCPVALFLRARGR